MPFSSNGLDYACFWGSMHLWVGTEVFNNLVYFLEHGFPPTRE